MRQGQRQRKKRDRGWNGHDSKTGVKQGTETRKGSLTGEDTGSRHRGRGRERRKKAV